MATLYHAERAALTFAAGSAASPASAASYPVYDVTLNPRVGETLPGFPYVGDFSAGETHIGAEYCALSFRTPVYGQRATGEHWYFGRLLEACGFGVSGTTAFTYTMGDLHEDGDTPDGITEPVSLTVNIDGIQHICANCVGTVKFICTAGDYLWAEFSFIGTDTVAAASGASATSQTAFGTLVQPVRCANGSASVGGVSMVMPYWEFDVQNRMDLRRDVNGINGVSQTKLTGRAPVGYFIGEVQALGTYNAETEAFRKTGKTSTAFSYTHNDGGTVFDEILFTFSLFQQAGVAPWEPTSAGLVAWRVPFTLNPTGTLLTIAWSDN